MSARPASWPDLGREGADGWEYDFTRLSFGLTYAHEERVIGAYGIDGRQIPNAYRFPDDGEKHADEAPGDWSQEISDSGGDPVRHVLSCAVNEAVHEALEWTKLDGRPLLDPHGSLERDIFAAVSDLSDRLFALAATPRPDQGEQR